MIKGLLASIIDNRQLILEMTKRDLMSLNKGSIIGWLWVVINPLIQTGAYILIVSFIFKTRLNSDAGTFDYALYILSGMIPWQILTRSLQNAPTIIRMRMEFVKQVIYPIETLPLSTILMGSVGSMISFAIFLILSLISGNVNWSFILIPIPFLLLIIFSLGVSWVFSILGIIIKDLREIVTVFFSLIIYLSPVVVNENICGPKLWKIILINPLAHIVICFRDVFNGTLHIQSWIIFITITAFFGISGALVMKKFKIKINEFI